jgi:hypothetical protein
VQSTDSAEATQSAMQQQLQFAEALNDEITYQGKALSMFTALNVLFLPLGFLSQVSYRGQSPMINVADVTSISGLQITTSISTQNSG